LHGQGGVKEIPADQSGQNGQQNFIDAHGFDLFS
jgi:hypothetical protein